MGVTSPKAVFFHIPKTGGTWVTESVLRAFPETDKTQPKAEKMNVDVGWEQDINGIHISPNKVKVKKFSYTFVRHPLTWWPSYWKLNRVKTGEKFDEFVRGRPGHYTWIVKQFEGVDFIGKQESLAFDLEDALLEAGEKFNPDDFLVQHANVSMEPDAKMTDSLKKFILKNEKYIIDKYYDGK